MVKYSEQICIQRASTDDIQSLHQILIACGLDLNKRFGLSHWIPPNYPLEQMIQDGMENEVYAVIINGDLVGTFTLEITTIVPYSYAKYGKIVWQISNIMAVYVHKLAILPTWQGKGLGSKCIQAIEKLAIDRSCYSVRLDGVKTHSNLLSFYKNRGYQPVGELTYNSDVWVDAIVFEKVLVSC